MPSRPAAGPHVRRRFRRVLVPALAFALGLVVRVETLAAAPSPSATPVPGLREEVAARHALEREAHLDRNVDLLMSLFADDFVLVDGGAVRRPTREENRAHFAAYFERVRFRRWDDLDPPSIRVSRDGTLATVIVRKEVVLVPADAPDDAVPERAVFAWMETWERRQGRWMLVALCSTRAAGDDG